MAQSQINHATRRVYAELLRHFLAGRMITDKYEDAYFALQKSGHDDAVEHVFAACWHLYDDIIPHRMTGRRALDRASRRRAARWVLFLRSGAQYAGDELPPSHAGHEQALHARFNLVMWLVIFAVLLAGAILGCSGVAAGYLLALLAVVAYIVAAATGCGVAVNSSVFARAFCDDRDPWPFASQQDLAQAVARPVYLIGSERRASDRR